MALELRNDAPRLSIELDADMTLFLTHVPLLAKISREQREVFTEEDITDYDYSKTRMRLERDVFMCKFAAAWIRDWTIIPVAVRPDMIARLTAIGEVAITSDRPVQTILPLELAVRRAYPSLNLPVRIRDDRSFDLSITDAPSHIDRILERGGRVIVVEWPYNRSKGYERDPGAVVVPTAEAGISALDRAIASLRGSGVPFTKENIWQQTREFAATTPLSNSERQARGAPEKCFSIR